MKFYEKVQAFTKTELPALMSLKPLQRRGSELAQEAIQLLFWFIPNPKS